MKKTAIITGSTSGIGEASARLLAKDFRLILCGRREDRLEKLNAELAGETEILPLSFDVTDQHMVNKKLTNLPPGWKEIDLLINNAGNAHGLDFFHEADVEDWEAMIDSNVKGLLYVSKAVVPGMVKRKSGHIINIGSIAGVEVYPKGTVYNASKFAVDAITKGMRIDLNPHGIKVAEIKPGLVNTEFSLVRFKGDEGKASQVYQGIQPLTARDVAEVIAFMVSRPAHVNIADLLILPTDQATATIVNRK